MVHRYILDKYPATGVAEKKNMCSDEHEMVCCKAKYCYGQTSYVALEVKVAAKYIRPVPL